MRMGEMMHVTAAQIEEKLDWVKASPSEKGTLEALCIRPEVNERKVLESCLLSPELGVEGDFWVRNCWKKLDDKTSDPVVQVAIMNARAVDIVAGSRDRWILAGDQLYVDFDLSEANLPPGALLKVGSAVIEISSVPHTGCKLFHERYGVEALKFFNSKVGSALRLRGVFGQIVQEGVVTVGDVVEKG